ncbi:hypothetical protein IGG_05660, partial [Bacillus cereus HuB13-1]
HIGAWIEIIVTPLEYPSKKVAPHIGAWIEIQWESVRLCTF